MVANRATQNFQETGWGVCEIRPPCVTPRWCAIPPALDMVWVSRTGFSIVITGALATMVPCQVRCGAWLTLKGRSGCPAVGGGGAESRRK